MNRFGVPVVWCGKNTSHSNGFEIRVIMILLHLESISGIVTTSRKSDSPPIIYVGPSEACRASSRLVVIVQSVDRLGFVDNTIFLRFFNGRNFSGIESQVFLPMITVPFSVVRRKCFRSSLNFHGRPPLLPIPIFLQTATTKLKVRLSILKFILGKFRLIKLKFSHFGRSHVCATYTARF